MSVPRRTMTRTISSTELRKRQHLEGGPSYDFAATILQSQILLVEI
jgi:hypothetical protein